MRGEDTNTVNFAPAPTASVLPPIIPLMGGMPITTVGATFGAGAIYQIVRELSFDPDTSIPTVSSIPVVQEGFQSGIQLIDGDLPASPTQAFWDGQFEAPQ